MTREEQFKPMRETHKKMLRETHEKMLLTKRETAKELSVSEAGIDRLRAAGDLESKKVLGQIMFQIDEIARYLSE